MALKSRILTSFWKAQRLLLFPIWNSFIYHLRVNKKGNPVRSRKVFGRFNQFLMEKGFMAPWINSPQECLDFWNRITNEDRFVGNRPIDYAAKSAAIIEFLQDFWSPHITRENSILELGCNCGVNLNYLYNSGYKNLSGMEINKNAIEKMKSCFPELLKNITIFTGSLEELLPKIPANSVDVVITMAVLIHIHPKSNFIFSEMLRIAKKFICTVELESANCSYLFARNYRRVFSQLGCSQLKSALIARDAYPSVDRMYDGYIARLFTIPAKS